MALKTSGLWGTEHVAFNRGDVMLQGLKDRQPGWCVFGQKLVSLDSQALGMISRQRNVFACPG